MIFIVHFIYLRAIKPPADILPDDSIKSVENACRILSYIPFVSDPAMFPGFCDLWTTAEQVFQLIFTKYYYYNIVFDEKMKL